MSSLRNSVQRRNHRERAQPKEREKWGILEKHKDYALRAKDFNEKKKRLRILREKAAARNPDEFSFAMMSTKSDGGRKIADRGNKALSMDVVKLLKTQDVGYIRTMLQVVRKERRRLEEEIVLEDDEVRVLREGDERKSRHTVFVGSEEEQKRFEAEEWFGTGGGEGLDRVWNRPRKGEAGEGRDMDEDMEEDTKAKRLSRREQEAKLQAEKDERILKKKRERAQEGRMAHLEAVKARERDLMIAEEELEKQRAKMNGTVGGINKSGVKFKVRERKR
ncbi:U3 small nucleolar RNA-associated protein Utp11 [Glonium stellatum]|uniref:U3 small nucleolar RNA-associated protein Utp11 n=1 Tax=Glonium stellatum TaxID=574774 RepID=A0A8E2F8H3_9PEZI|nr:U3 small nucleolar RNA-associated protein Utp11 [Glonium stellatum]